MKKNGFTLIELLAVILILGIIALIAIPTVNSVIEQSRKGAVETGTTNIVSAIQMKCSLEKMKKEDITELYVFTKDGIKPEVNVKGKLPESGMAKVNNKCEVRIYAETGNYVVVKDYDEEIRDAYNKNDGLVKPIEFAEYDRAVVMAIPATMEEILGMEEGFADLYDYVDRNFWKKAKPVQILGFKNNNQTQVELIAFAIENVDNYSIDELNKNCEDMKRFSVHFYEELMNASCGCETNINTPDFKAEVGNTLFIYDNRLIFISQKIEMDVGATITDEDVDNEITGMASQGVEILYDFK